MKPPSAVVRAEDCSFEKGLCGWENTSVADNDRTVMWQRAFQTHRPAQLLDRTFGAPGDFIFFDIFTTNKQSAKVQLRSPVINAMPDEEFVCFTFWFAAFGVEESTTLRVIRLSAGNGNEEAENEQEHLVMYIKYKRDIIYNKWNIPYIYTQICTYCLFLFPQFLFSFWG